MSVLYPLATVNTASITSLVRMTLYHRSIGVYPDRVETSEGVAALGGKGRITAVENLVARPDSEVGSGRSEKNQMAIDYHEGKVLL
jgi:hypothetical protein